MSSASPGATGARRTAFAGYPSESWRVDLAAVHRVRRGVRSCATWHDTHAREERLRIKSDAGDPPVVKAIRDGDVKLVQELVDHGASLGQFGELRTTPLHVAVEMRQLDVVEFLLMRGSGPNVCDVSLARPIQVAFRATPMERQAFRQLRQAVEDVCRDVPVAHLLRPEEWPPHRPRSALVRPNWCRRIEGFPVSGPTRALTAAVAERAVSRLDPVSQAVVRMHQWIVELLLEAGAQPNCTTSPATMYETENQDMLLHTAIEAGQLGVALSLLLHGASARNRGRQEMPLHLACRDGLGPLAVVLLECGASPTDCSYMRSYTDPPFSYGTPFDYANLQGHAELAEAMLLVGARFDKNPGATFDEAFRRAPVPSEDARRAYRSAWEAYRGYWLRPGCAVGAKGTCVS